MTGAPVTVVAGGASGIGLSLAQRLLQEGKPVHVLDQRMPVASAGLGFSEVDLRSFEQLEQLAQSWQGRTEIGGLAVVAGVGFGTTFEQMTQAQFMLEVNANLTVAFNAFRAFLPCIPKGGSLVAVSSVNALGGIGSCAYAAAKAGVIGLVKSLAVELAPKGIRVNAVVPGAVRTPMLDSLVTPMQQTLLHRFSPLGSAEPSQIAAVIHTLLGADASHVTGQAWVVDGGLSASYRPAL